MAYMLHSCHQNSFSCLNKSLKYQIMGYIFLRHHLNQQPPIILLSIGYTNNHKTRGCCCNVQSLCGFDSFIASGLGAVYLSLLQHHNSCKYIYKCMYAFLGKIKHFLIANCYAFTLFWQHIIQTAQVFTYIELGG